ncbi:hypothetical protein DL98DRAFT_560308 [Cadophora sp. DSE1049]|nr:hypothetical protein DL98DRAFT_560308 [Cadophora sp. DSE1049]
MARRGATNSKVADSNPKSSRRQARADQPLTCTNCRTRKTRCDGTQPGCKTCEVYNDQCHYEKPPPMSQILAMATRLQEVEAELAALKSSGLSLAHHDILSEGQISTSVSEASFEPQLSEAALQQSKARQISNVNADEHLQSNESESLPTELSLDENGKVCYYGPTSSVHQPPGVRTNPSPRSDQVTSPSSAQAPSILASSPLDCWIAPMSMWVYRPAFMRDMSTGGKYYSNFLLMILCAHSSRFQEGNVDEMLLPRIRMMIGTEIDGPSSIPMVQGLLQLSARQFALGLISQAWLYSGMAFRMVIDMGLHQNSGKLLDIGGLTAEDVEIRRRLYWSCYFWDKAISLYLGRLPTLTDIPAENPPRFKDFWSPHHGPDVTFTVLPANQYPAMKSHAISCFENSCKLAIIISDIILQFYSRRAPEDVEGALRRLKERLDDWRARSPRHLVLDPDSLPSVCCPPHILTQNLLYYTTVILLHRPTGHQAACRSAANSIEKLLLLLEGTFGFTRVTYLIAYCIYTGASAMIQGVKSGDTDANTRMETFLRALNIGVQSCPILQKSLDIINASMATMVPEPQPVPSETEVGNVGTVGYDPAFGNFLPAFPYTYNQNQMDFANQDNFGNMDLDSMLMLDCFPENSIDATGAAWFGSQ